MRVDAGADQSGVEQLANSDFVFVAGGPVSSRLEHLALGFPSERRHCLFVDFLRGLNGLLVAEKGAIVSQISTISLKS